MKKIVAIIISGIILATSVSAFAHGGRTDKMAATMTAKPERVTAIKAT